ncbi:hypothetical protein EDD90_3299 [Streptomyces sp. Ag109_O5-1]|nr:hypothetical protein EDD90_3299 [Streptomyces sp. Ag109_O5-1]
MTAAGLLDTVEVERLALQPGDILVFKCPMRLSDAEYTEIYERIKERLPDTEAMILEGGMDIAVLRAEP